MEFLDSFLRRHLTGKLLSGRVTKCQLFSEAMIPTSIFCCLACEWSLPCLIFSKKILILLPGSYLFSALEFFLISRSYLYHESFPSSNMQAQTLHNLHDKTKMKLETHNSEHYRDLFWFEQFVHLVTLGITILLICCMCLQKIQQIWHLCKSTAFTNGNISRQYAKILEIPKFVHFWAAFIRSRGKTWGKSLPWGWYGYFLTQHNIIIGKKSTYASQLVEVQGDLPLLVHQHSAKATQSYFTNMNHKIIHY